MSKIIRLSKLKQDDRNFNKHTDEGMRDLEKSIETVGVIEAVTISEDEKIISGNARHEKMSKIFGSETEPIVIETDGRRPVVIKRTDIKSNTKEFHLAAMMANTTAKKNINLDMGLIQEVMVEEFEIDVKEFGVEVVDFDYSDIDALSENSLRDQINSSGQTQLTFVFEPEHREIIDKYMERHGKKALQSEILKIMQNA